MYIKQIYFTDNFIFKKENMNEKSININKSCQKVIKVSNYKC